LEARRDGVIYRSGYGPESAAIRADSDNGDRRSLALRLQDQRRFVAIVETKGTGLPGQPHKAAFSFRNIGELSDFSSGPEPWPPGLMPGVSETRLVDLPGLAAEPLHTLYTSAIEQGRGPDVFASLCEVVQGLVRVEILTEGDAPVVHTVFEDHSVPVALAGDGVQALMRLVLKLVAKPGALLLIEEPECHQHPRAIGQTCRAIWAALRQDVQVVLTTHSLDLIDNLLAEAKTDEDLDKLAIFNVHLENGVLSAAKSGGREAAFARTEIANDLR
jgi:hypothetical protein